MNGWMIDEAMLVRVLYDADFFKWVLMGMWRRGLWRWSPMFLPLLDATTSSIVIVEGVKVGGHDIRTQHKIHTHYIYICCIPHDGTHYADLWDDWGKWSDAVLWRSPSIFFLLFFFFLLMHPGRGPGARAVCVTPVAQDPTCTLWPACSGCGRLSCSQVRGRYPSCTLPHGQSRHVVR